MSAAMKSASAQGSESALASINAVSEASTDIDTANVFLKLLKKAEEAAQSGM